MSTAKPTITHTSGSVGVCAGSRYGSQALGSCTGKKGSAGGHNGIKSILAHVGDEHFARVRIGIGRPLPGWTVVNHVLAAFSEEDAPKITEAINYLIPAVECIVNEDVDMAMNRYNPKKQKKQKKQVQSADMAAETAGKGETVHE